MAAQQFGIHQTALMIQRKWKRWAEGQEALNRILIVDTIKSTARRNEVL
jgi:hypothetical protein